jgi:hypothetical protein
MLRNVSIKIGNKKIHPNPNPDPFQLTWWILIYRYLWEDKINAQQCGHETSVFQSLP